MHLVESAIRTLGYLIKAKTEINPCEASGFSNSVFEINPYRWCDNEDNTCLPNFYHRASGLSVTWYKHLGRGMEIDQADDEKWAKVFIECFRSIGYQLF